MTTRSRVIAFRVGEQEESIRIRVHPRARWARLKVIPPGEIELVVPPYYPGTEVGELIHRHHDWLVTQLRDVRDRVAANGGQTQPTELNLPCIEARWSVAYRPGALSRVTERGDQLSVGVVDGHWHLPLQRWLNQTARRHLVPRLEALANAHGLTVAGVTIRAQRSRWGSCSATGRINLNRNLLFLPPDVVRYLLVHELCHLRHLNHSTKFWQMVERLEPDFRRLDRALRGAMQQIPWWAVQRPAAS